MYETLSLSSTLVYFIIRFEIDSLGRHCYSKYFLQNIQFNPFTYLCHCVYSEAGLKMKFPGIEKAMSLCNISIVTAVCRLFLEVKPYLDWMMKSDWTLFRAQRTGYEHRVAYEDPLMEEQRKLFVKRLEERRKWCLNQLMEGLLKSYLHQLMKEHRKPYLHQLIEEHLKSNLYQLMEACWESGIKQSTKLPGFVSPELFREVCDDAFKIDLWRNIPEGFQKLLDCINGDILTCVSPKMQWVIQADVSLQVSKLQTENQEEHHTGLEKPVHTFSKFTRFTCSKDDLLFVHQPTRGSLQALSFKTGKVLSSVSGCKVGYFTRERQVSLRTGSLWR